GAANGVRGSGQRSRRRRMEAVMVQMSASESRERLFAFVDEVARRLPHVRQRENALLYVRGLIEQGGRKSLQPTLFRLQETPARYESMQQFLADSPWDPALLVQACVERVAPEIGVIAWVIDDTGIAKDGRHSPGVKRQYSGALGQIGNCQIVVSVHAVGERGTLPLGFSLYLPQEWCSDQERRRQAKIPDEVVFQSKPHLAAALCARAAAWRLPAAPILADCAYGDDSAVRVVATHPVRNDNQPPREEWLIIEWPANAEAPSDYWLSNLPPRTPRERLARLARLRWTIELDYRQLKGELGLDHYEGRSYAGFHHHCALVTCAHTFLTLERLDPKAPRPA